MRQPRNTTYSISDFLEWKASKQLVIAPKFQRRSIWVPKAKSYLIDTILRSMPIPPLFIRSKIDPSAQRAYREVVDGQQRLRSVFEFIEGAFPILKTQNEEYGGMFYHELSEDTKREFLNYHFAVNLLDDVSDEEVLDIFARMNTYTEPLNAQELRNSKYFGLFKQTVYKIAHDYYKFWRKSEILTEHQVARMKDAELVSILMVTMMDGIRQTKDIDLREFYENYDEEFKRARILKNQFGDVIDIIGESYGDNISSSPFKRHPLFYSLYTVIYDAFFGFPRGSNKTRIKMTSERIRRTSSNLLDLSNIILNDKPPDKLTEKQIANCLSFLQATKLSTADVEKRKLRHRVMWNMIIVGDKKFN